MKERSHLKWHTFGWDKAIHIKQLKHMEAYINACVWKYMKAYKSIERSHLKRHTFLGGCVRGYKLAITVT